MTDNILNSEAAAPAEAPVAESATTETAAAPEAVVESPAVTNELNLLDHVSDDFKYVIDKKGFKDLNDVVKSYVNLERMVGNSVRIPGEDASEEAKKEFYEKLKDVDGVILKDSEDMYTKLGRPESAEGYNLQDLVDAEIAGAVPNLGQEISDFQKTAHEIGLSKEQAAKLLEMRMGTLKSANETWTAKREAGEAELRKMWGEDHDNRLAAAKNVAKMYSEQYPDAMSELLNSQAGNNPAFINMLSELGRTFKETGHAGMQKAQFGTTPAEAAQKIADKRADTGFMKAYHDSMHPGHKQAVSEMMRLYELANK